MALQQQTIPMPFRSGLNLKSDPKQLPMGQLAVLENAVFSTPMSLVKRFGNEQLTTTIGNSTKGLSDINQGKALMSFNNELLLADIDRLYSFDQSNDVWIEKGILTSPSATQVAISRDQFDGLNSDSAIHPDGLQVCVWTGGESLTLQVALTDTHTNQVIQTTDLGVGGQSRAIAFANYLFVFYTSGTSDGTWLQPYSTVNPTVPLAPISWGASDGPIDVCVIPGTNGNPDKLYTVQCTGVGFVPNTYIVKCVVSTAPLTVFQTVTKTGITLNGDLTIFADTIEGGPVVGWYTTASATIHLDAYTEFTSSTPTLLHSLTFTGAQPSFAGVTAPTATAAGSWQIWQSKIVASDGLWTVNYVQKTIISAYSVVSTTIIARSVAQITRPFAYQDVVYCGVMYESPLNSTYYIINEDGVAVAKALQTLASEGIGTYAGTFPHNFKSVSQTGSSTFTFTVSVVDRLIALGEAFSTGTAPSALVTTAGITALTFDFDDTLRSYSRASIGESLFVGGSIVSQYDGRSVVEAGFNVFPEGFTVTKSDTGGSLGSASQPTTYFWTVLYEWTDLNGRIYQSRPAPPVSISFAAEITTGMATLNIPTCRLTQKPGAVIKVYRTIGTAPGVFYSDNTFVNPKIYVGTPIHNAPIVNNKTIDSVQFKDTIPDTALIGGDQIYTTGNVLENDPPPPMTGLTIYQNRLWGIDTTNPLSIWYSAQVAPGESVDFSSFSVLNADPRIGAVRSLGVIDANLIIYGDTQTFVTNGQGPDRTGSGSQLQDPQLTTTEVGCPNPRSVVATQNGLMSQSTKGIYIEDRALTSGYIGASVEKLTKGHSIRSALVVPKYNQVRFLLDSNNAIVYDTFMEQWSSFTNMIDGVDACIWEDEWTWLSSEGVVYTEVEGSYSDHGQAITMSVKTGPIRMGVISGYQRVWDFLILGTYQSPHDIVVKVYYDGASAYSQTTTVTPLDPSLWGQDPNWGDSPLWGGSPFVPYIYRVFIQNDLCESLQIELDVTPTGTSLGGGAQLSGLTFNIGVLKGSFRTGQQSQY